MAAAIASAGTNDASPALVCTLYATIERATASATLMPSIAADMMPPA
jgi:hypothetical protein